MASEEETPTERPLLIANDSPTHTDANSCLHASASILARCHGACDDIQSLLGNLQPTLADDTLPSDAPYICTLHPASTPFHSVVPAQKLSTAGAPFSHPQALPPPDWRCHDCDRSFSSRSALMSHRQQKRHRTSPGVCGECGRVQTAAPR